MSDLLPVLQKCNFHEGRSLPITYIAIVPLHYPAQGLMSTY